MLSLSALAISMTRCVCRGEGPERDHAASQTMWEALTSHSPPLSREQAASYLVQEQDLPATEPPDRPHGHFQPRLKPLAQRGGSQQLVCFAPCLHLPQVVAATMVKVPQLLLS